jgi:PEP-CTERM motif
MTTQFKRIAAASLLAAASCSSFAVDSVALTTQNVNGDQTFTGGLGMDFTVNMPIIVKQLGAYDAAPVGITGPVDVAIFRISDGMMMGSSASFGLASPGTLVGTDRFLDIPDYVLAPGLYSIVAVGFSLIDLNGNLDPTGGARTPSIINDGGGLITFGGGSRYGFSPTLVLPGITDGGPANRYDAGTFVFSPVPEPSSYLMMLAALGVIGTVVRRRSAV